MGRMVGGARSWWVVAMGCAWLIACAPPCVDDGLHAKQGGAGCTAATTGSTGTSTGTTTTTTSADTTGTTTGTTTDGSATSTGEPTSGSTSSTSSTSGTSSTGAPGCADGQMNGDESDTDCGGSCPQCADFQRCVAPDDCASQHCHKAGLCVPDFCDDGLYTEASELHIDCGAMCGATCGLGFPCADKGDCAEGDCINNTCELQPHCANEMFDVGVEVNLDCGAECGKTCKTGSSCTSDDDCYGICDANSVCVTDSCINQMPDPGETDVDCGGLCGTCPFGAACIVDGDCGGGIPCVGKKCGG